MNYNDLLQSENWKNKRLEILRRDNHTCQRCGSGSNYVSLMDTVIKILDPSEFPGLISGIKISKTNNYNVNTARITSLHAYGIITAKTTLSQHDLSEGKSYKLVINYVLNSWIKYPYNGSTINNLNDNILLNENTNLGLIKSMTEIGINKWGFDSKKQSIDKEGIWLTEDSKSHEFTKTHSLHVHHKCYRKNIQIWNQKNEEYVTLCNVCHAIVHNNQFIPYYDENGMIYQYMEPCWKCGGRRYLDQYKNINGGICYGCWGSGTNIQSAFSNTYHNLTTFVDTPSLNKSKSTENPIIKKNLEANKESLSTILDQINRNTTSKVEIPRPKKVANNNQTMKWVLIVLGSIIFLIIIITGANSAPGGSRTTYKTYKEKRTNPSVNLTEEMIASIPPKEEVSNSFESQQSIPVEWYMYEEIIDGPANIRDEISSRIKFILNDGIEVETSTSLDSRIIVGAYIRLTPNQLQESIILPYEKLIGFDGVEIGTSQDTLHFKLIEDNIGFITGITHPQNLKLNYLPEFILSNIILNNGHDFEDLIQFISQNKFEKFGEFVLPNHDLYYMINSFNDDVSPRDRISLYFDKNEMLSAIVHDRRLFLNEYETHDLTRGHKLTIIAGLSENEVKDMVETLTLFYNSLD